MRCNPGPHADISRGWQDIVCSRSHWLDGVIAAAIGRKTDSSRTPTVRASATCQSARHHARLHKDIRVVSQHPAA